MHAQLVSPSRVAALGGQLNPLRNSPLPLTRSSPMKQIQMASQSDQNRSANAMILRGLRRDVLEMQNLLDVFYQREIPSAEGQQLEDTLLVLQSSDSVENHLFGLLRLVQQRSAQLAAVCGVATCANRYAPLEPCVGELISVCRSLVALEEEIAALSLQDALTGSTQSVHEARNNNNTEAQQRQQGRERLMLQIAAREESRQKLRDDAVSGGVLEMDGTLGSATFSGPSPSLTFGSRFGGKGAPAPRIVASRELSAAVQILAEQQTTESNHAASASKPLPLVEEGREVDMETVARLLQMFAEDIYSTRCRSPAVSSSIDPLLTATAAASVERHQRALNLVLQKLSAAEEELHKKNAVIDDMQQKLNKTRFQPNRLKTITSVHDSPMSFQVEREYLKEHQRAMLRVQELEKAYDDLFQAGADDRERSAKLEKEVERLQSTVRHLEAEAEAMRSQHAEQDQLFEGLSRTRREEAQMCTTAVAQLEHRVKQLTEEIDCTRQEHAILLSNFESLFDNWCVSQQRLEEGKAIREFLDADYKLYRNTYHIGTVETLESTQKQLLSVWRHADEQEAEKAALRQQLEDARNAIRVLQEESKQLMDRVRSSTEWKLLTVKSPEEIKQLQARWQAMQADREKREAAAVKYQNDRIQLFKQRAGIEVATRQAQHQAEVRVVSAVDMRSAHLSKRPAAPAVPGYRPPRPYESGDPFEVDHPFGEDAIESAASANNRIPPDVRGGFLQEVSKRILTFEQFWQELFPEDD